MPYSASVSQHALGTKDRLTGRRTNEAGPDAVENLSQRQRLAVVLRLYSQQLHESGAFAAADLIRIAAKELEGGP